VGEIVRAARQAGVRFVILTDHNTEAARAEEGWREGVLVVVGLEKSTDAGHAVVLGAPPLPFGLDGDPAEVVRDAGDLGGFVVAAHPADAHPERRWKGDLGTVAGIEVLSFGPRASWPAGASIVPLLARYPLDGTGALLSAFRFSRAALDLWDRLLAARPVAGFLGLDAHGGVLASGIVLPFPSYGQMFRLASQHVLLDRPLGGDFGVDRAAVLDALRRGRGFVAVDALADASAFTFEAVGAGGHAGPGESVRFSPGLRLVADAGGVPGTRLVLLANGRPLTRGPSLDVPVEAPGVYRVEAYLEDGGSRGPGEPLPWVITNAIAILPQAELDVRAARGRPPALPAPPEGDTTVLADFGAPPAPAWQVDRAEGASASVRVEEGALRFDFGLGPAAPTHASIADWEPRSFGPDDVLTFRVRSDRRMRFDLQVCTRDQGADARVRIWRRSVRAEPEWQRAAVPLVSLKTYDGRPGTPRLSDVVGLYVHVDEANLPPASRGTLWIDDVSLVHPRPAR
jgi:hypothetical protein